MSGDDVRAIVILGGGTAGWMTAAALSRALQGSGRQITLVESDAIGTVGVGEATIPTIHWFNQIVGIDEAEFLRETKATFKLGIAFAGWNGEDSAYFHPFGTFGPPGDGVMFLHRLLRGRRDGMTFSTEEASLSATAARLGRFAKPASDPRSLLSTLGYAYHFDAFLYARFLQRIAEANGVRRVEGRVQVVERNGEEGTVAALTTERGDRLAGDLFIDCSGFRALLIGDALGTAYDDWSPWLPCDRAWSAPTSANGAFAP